MANRRMIYSDMFDDSEIGTLPREARLLWVGLIVSLADDQGRILDHLSLIKSRAFVFDDDLDPDDIAKWLSMLEEIGCIYRYTKGGKNLIQIVKWWGYQTPSWAQVQPASLVFRQAGISLALKLTLTTSLLQNGASKKPSCSRGCYDSR